MTKTICASASLTVRIVHTVYTQFSDLLAVEKREITLKCYSAQLADLFQTPEQEALKACHYKVNCVQSSLHNTAYSEHCDSVIMTRPLPRTTFFLIFVVLYVVLPLCFHVVFISANLFFTSKAATTLEAKIASCIRRSFCDTAAGAASIRLQCRFTT